MEAESRDLAVLIFPSYFMNSRNSGSLSTMSDKAQESVGGEDKAHLEVEGQIPVKVEFTGGLELLFSNQRSHRISLPSGVPVAAPDNPGERSTDECMQTRPADIKYLLHYLRDNLLQERVELFMENDTMYEAPSTSR